MGTRTGFTTNVGVAEPAGGAMVTMARSKPKPMLVGLAIAGWATFAVEWIVVLVIILGRGGGANNVTVAQAADRPAITNTTPRATATTPSATATPPRTTTNPPPTTTPTRARPAVIDNNNPFLALAPNALGMTLNPGHTAVLLDAVDRSSAWFDDGKAALIAGLTRPSTGQTVSLFTIRDGAIGTFDSNPFAPAPAQLSPLTRFLNPITPLGSRGLGSGLDAAIASGAQELIFITSRATNWSGYLPTLKDKLNPSGRKVTLHFLQLGDNSPELRSFVEARDNGGRYTLITPEQLKAWRSATN